MSTWPLTCSQGGEKYQQAFYVFEELAQAPATSTTWSLVSQAICELHLGRLEESQAALEQALQKDPSSADAIANLLVLTVVSGKDPKEFTEYASSSHVHVNRGSVTDKPAGHWKRSTLATVSWWT